MKRGLKKPIEKVECAEMKVRALNLRAQGLSYRMIAKVMNITAMTAHNYVTDELKNIPKEAADELRKIKTEEYAQLKIKWMQPALDGDPQAATVYLKILADERKMLGIDAPVEVDITSGGTPIVPVINFTKEGE